jgi:hypothetical protein
MHEKQSSKLRPARHEYAMLHYTTVKLTNLHQFTELNVVIY